MKIFAVRIGDKYGPEYETYLEKKLSDYEMVWIREPYDSRVALQWNKMWAMQLDIDEPICIMDIDVLLVNDYKKVFEYPVERGQFVAMLVERHKERGVLYKWWVLQILPKGL